MGKRKRNCGTLVTSTQLLKEIIYCKKKEANVFSMDWGRERCFIRKHCIENKCQCLKSAKVADWRRARRGQYKKGKMNQDSHYSVLLTFAWYPDFSETSNFLFRIVMFGHVIYGKFTCPAHIVCQKVVPSDRGLLERGVPVAITKWMKCALSVFFIFWECPPVPCALS